MLANTSESEVLMKVEIISKQIDHFIRIIYCINLTIWIHTRYVLILLRGGNDSNSVIVMFLDANNV